VHSLVVVVVFDKVVLADVWSDLVLILILLLLLLLILLLILLLLLILILIFDFASQKISRLFLLFF